MITVVAEEKRPKTHPPIHTHTHTFGSTTLQGYANAKCCTGIEAAFCYSSGSLQTETLVGLTGFRNRLLHDSKGGGRPTQTQREAASSVERLRSSTALLML